MDKSKLNQLNNWKKIPLRIIKTTKAILTNHTDILNIIEIIQFKDFKSQRIIKLFIINN